MTHLAGEPTVGSIQGWHAGEAKQAPDASEPSATDPSGDAASRQAQQRLEQQTDRPENVNRTENVNRPEHLNRPERTPAQRAEDAARLAWYQRDKPPHWS
ncbi:hypothetical protein DWQ67_01345 [Galactobacter caseinivorans]|uniref:Uncharacterized protein n=2 Tax=Galactobacter caseinivorans TaxID=2676123 RepID=A0A496PM26_9MICC|nr:hypothetical protein DWQ67_01345 [Galactobacter caseinivorans]